jgi:hypothetical protein
MPVPKYSIPSSGHRRLFSCIFSFPLLFVLSTIPVFAKGPEAPLRIPLEPLGFQTLSTQFLLAGSSLLTLHYVDDHHILLTFTVHRLLSRLPDESEDDRDRNVDALLLEVPTGRVLARTSWRLHDHGEYLWDLGHGHFLLRIHDRLTTFAPLANLATGEPFAQHPFLEANGRRMAALLLSPDASLLIVETVPRTPPAPRPKTPLFGPTPPPPPDPPFRPNQVQINFYRLSPSSDSHPVDIPRFAGVVRSNGTGNIASTAAGYLAIIDQGQQHWAFDFNSYAGKKVELAAFDSTCRPSPYFVNGSEFVAFGCRGGSSRLLLGGFNMRGEEMWEQKLYGDYVAPFFTFAPSSGRFALSRILVHSSAISDQAISADVLDSQAVVVYQSGSGKQIFRADCVPVQRAGQNFALSPDGLSLALIRADAIEIDKLPPLTTKENADVKLAAASAPEESDAPIHFSAAETASSDTETDEDPSTATDSLSSSTSQAIPSDTPAQTQGGDPPPEQPRKAPTLYTLPTDPPHSSTTEDPR